MMPDLPNVDLERDIQQFIEFFENPRFRPDGLKLYPTLVIRYRFVYKYVSCPQCVFQGNRSV